MDLEPRDSADSAGVGGGGGGGGGEHVMLHSPTVMMHFPSDSSALLGGQLDDWGQVQPPGQQDQPGAPSNKPRVVHRGLEGLPEIPDGECAEGADHLAFVVHGIGSACDLRMREIAEVVDGYRALTADLAERHFSRARLSGAASRVEFLPVNWHTTLHGEGGGGTDERLRPHTLRSIPKMRHFVNDTLLDVLFYTSPVHCQTIVDTVVSEINRMYTLFMARNESFSGSVSLIGHSLGSVVLFDVLSHQDPDGGAEDSFGGNQQLQSSQAATLDAPAPAQLGLPAQDQFLDVGNPSTLEDLFSRLGMGQHAEIFTREGIDLEALRTCAESDLTEAGLPEAEKAKLWAYLTTDKKNKKAAPSAAATTSTDYRYVLGPAGTGQPSVRYPRLCFQPAAFYAFGSPIGMFQAVRGVERLGPDFKLPTCPRLVFIMVL